MINANQITSRLRMMSDQELQRFAEMHKQDPYMFPLAFNESNMRKEMRSAPQGQGAAPQAPVNQQALAAMQPAQLPEDQGIGALNPNMQFADGGLVSFAGGGESTVGPYSRADDRDFGTGGVAYADGGAIRFQNRGSVPSAYGEYWPEDVFAPSKRRHWTAPNPVRDTPIVGEEAIRKLPYARSMQTTDEMRRARENEKEPWTDDAERLKLLAAAPPAPDRPGTDGPSVNKHPLPGNYATRTDGSGAGGVPIPTMSGGPGVARAPAAAVAPRPPVAAAVPGGLPPVGEDYRSAPAIEKMFGKYVTAAETEAQKRIEEYQKDRPAPETFAEQKALLEENRADVEKESRMNEGLAWLTFASRVVQPGKNTIQALVEGASAGGEQYARAQKDLKKAEKERKMGLAALAQAERAEKRNDYDKVEMYKQQAMQRADKARDASVLALSHATGKDTEIAAQRMDNALRIASQERMAAEQNAANLEAAKLAGQYRIDAANISVGGRDERTQQALDARFLTDLAKQWNDPGQRFQIGTQYPGVKSWEDFVKVKRFELQKAQNITGGKGGASPMTPTGVREEDD
jgi:hypothetical protein